MHDDNVNALLKVSGVFWCSGVLDLGFRSTVSTDSEIQRFITDYCNAYRAGGRLKYLYRRNATVCISYNGRVYVNG